MTQLELEVTEAELQRGINTHDLSTRGSDRVRTRTPRQTSNAEFAKPQANILAIAHEHV